MGGYLQAASGRAGTALRRTPGRPVGRVIATRWNVMATPHERGLSPLQAFLKRTLDLVGAFVGLALTWWVIAIAYVVATIDTKASGFFLQERVGRNGKLFKVIKIRTMRDRPDVQTNVTTDRDPRVTGMAAFCASRRSTSCRNC